MAPDSPSDKVVEALHKNIDRTLDLCKPLFIAIQLACAYLLVASASVVERISEIRTIEDDRRVLERFQGLYLDARTAMEKHPGRKEDGDWLYRWQDALAQLRNMSVLSHRDLPDFNEPGRSWKVRSEIGPVVTALYLAIKLPENLPRSHRMNPLGPPAESGGSPSPLLNALLSLIWCARQEPAFWKSFESELRQKDISGLKNSSYASASRTLEALEKERFRPSALQALKSVAGVFDSDKAFINEHLPLLNRFWSKEREKVDDTTLADVQNELTSKGAVRPELKLPVLGESVPGEFGFGASGIVLLILFHHWLLALLHLRTLQRTLIAKLNSGQGVPEVAIQATWLGSLFAEGTGHPGYAAVNRWIHALSFFWFPMLLQVGMTFALFRAGAMGAGSVTLSCGLLMGVDLVIYRRILDRAEIPASAEKKEPS